MTAYDTLRTAAAKVAEDHSAPPAALNLAGQILDAIAVLEVAEGGPAPQAGDDQAAGTAPEPIVSDSGNDEGPTQPATPTPNAGDAEPASATSASTAPGTAAADAPEPAPVDPLEVAPTAVDHAPASATEASGQ